MDLKIVIRFWFLLFFSFSFFSHQSVDFLLFVFLVTFFLTGVRFFFLQVIHLLQKRKQTRNY